MLKDFVQKKISNKSLVGILDGISKKGLADKIVSEHLNHNKHVWKTNQKNYIASSGLIEYQSNMEDIWYGTKRALWEMIPAVRCGSKDKAVHGDYNTCEVIALYNALKFTGRNVEFPELLAHFEKKGITSKGYFGTSVLALKKYLDDKKIASTLKYGDDAKSLEKDYDAFIITVYNNYQDITCMIHTMCVTKKGTEYSLHNAYSDRPIKASSINELVGKYKEYAKIISIIGVGNN